MAEALLKRFGDGRFHAFSAGIEPASDVHPLTIETIKASGLPTANLKPVSLREFLAASDQRLDFVIGIGKEVTKLPISLPGHPFTARWGITDPMASAGALPEKLAFRRAFREIENRIRLFVLVRHQPPQANGLETPSAQPA